VIYRNTAGSKPIPHGEKVLFLFIFSSFMIPNVGVKQAGVIAHGDTSGSVWLAVPVV
jgi:hypothetical protein